MNFIKLWILKILSGFFTLLGEIIVFFGVYSFLSAKGFGIIAAGLFLMLIGQMAGINAIKYEDIKKLRLFLIDVLENIGRQFAYPVLIFVIYLINKNELFLVLAFSLMFISLVKSLFIVYKATIIEQMIEIS